MPVKTYIGSYVGVDNKSQNIRVQVTGDHPDIAGWLKDVVYKGSKSVSVREVGDDGKEFGEPLVSPKPETPSEPLGTEQPAGA